MDIAERFWPQVERRGTDECWPWTGRLMTSGYGVFPVLRGEIDDRGHSVMGAHRMAFYLTSGHLPTAALHGCDFKLCCNAENSEHIHDGTLLLNNQEMFARGRARPRGRVPLTAEQRAELVQRYRPGVTRQVNLAEEFGVSQVRVSQILRGF